MDHKQSWSAKLHELFDPYKRWFKNKLPKKNTMRSGRVYRLFGSTLFKPELWSFKAEQMARGVALGTFIALTPTIGFQMALVCALIIFIPGNLPIALAACWITNPISSPAIYYLEYKLGEWIMSTARLMPGYVFNDSASISGIYDIAEAMWIGSLVSGIFGALVGYFVTLWLVGLERKLRFGKWRDLRNRKRKRTTT